MLLTRVLRVTGWTLISLGVLIALYVVYLLFFTNLHTQGAQRDLERELRSGWETATEDPGPSPPSEPVDPSTPTASPTAPPSPLPPVDPGEAYAAMWFERPGDEVRPVHAEVLYIVEGVTLDVLRDGPGHYPDSAGPGQEGNFAVAGHRTTYGAPFYHLDQLRPGDEIHVVDRAQREWVYVVTEAQVVVPTALWVVGSDPLETGRPTLTLTTCHPRFSAAQRYIVFAELRDGGRPRQPA